MKRIVTVLLLTGLLFTSSAFFAQMKKSDQQGSAYKPYSTIHHFESGNSSSPENSNSSFPGSHLSPQVVNGADQLPISSHYDVGSNSRSSLHNLIVDP